MAVLQQPVSTYDPFEDRIGGKLPPEGTFPGVVEDIADEFGVLRKKFESDEMENRDETTFLFRVHDPGGGVHRISSRRMRISGNEKSNLYKFLKSLMGRKPVYGWDYYELKGHKCLVTIEHVQKRDGTGTYAAIASLSPLPAGMELGGVQNVEAKPSTTVPPPPPPQAVPSVDGEEFPY